MQSWSSPPVPSLPGEGPALRLYDTARGQVVDATPPGEARLYVCGITPYDATHLGHAATYIAFDLAQRVWRDGGHAVRYVQNVTDVDDPLLERASATGVDWSDLAAREVELFRTDMSALRVLAPDLLVGVVESVEVVSRLVEQLRERGVTYELDGDVYCDVRADEQFGAVSAYDAETMRRLSAERGGDPDRPGKRDPVDPLLWQASATGVDWSDLAAREVELFRTDMSALRVLAPDLLVGVVESVEVVSRLVEQLRERGVTYELEGDVYCDVRADEQFGAVSAYDVETMRRLSAERGGDPDRPGKRDPVDPLLWQVERPGEPAWDSPLGRGRPGWHAECSALAVQHLGMGFDVQGGGNDLVFPHHEMSASQAQLATGERPFAQAYVHAGMVGFEGHKMSKSRGNLVLVSALRASGVDPMAIRLALLAHQYRSDWEWTDADLEQAVDRLACWRAALHSGAGTGADEVLADMRSALADDLDAPRALGSVDRWARDALAPDAVREPTDSATVRTAVDALLGVSL